MPEIGNIEEERSKEQVPFNKEEVNENISQKEIIETTQPEPQNSQPQTENMDVHKHPHHVMHKKKWGEYLLEFCMIFFAVFLGFVAENQWENIVEHQSEQEYMATMLEDLKSDTALLNYAVKYWNSINNSIDSLADAISFPLPKTNLFKAYCHLNNALDYYSFVYNDRTIAQLKNAGGFRLIRKKIVANKIIFYDQFNHNDMVNIAFQHNKFFENVVSLRNKVFVEDIINKIVQKYGRNPPPGSSYKWIDSMITNNRLPYTAEMQTTLFFEFKNALLAYRNDFSNVKWGYEQLLLNQINLITAIKKEYELDEDKN